MRLFCLISEREDLVDLLKIIGLPGDSGVDYTKGLDGFPAFELTYSSILQGVPTASYFPQDTLYQDFSITASFKLVSQEASLFAVLDSNGINQFGVHLATAFQDSKQKTAVTIYYTPNSSSKRRAEPLSIFYVPDVRNQWTVLGIKVRGSEVQLYKDCELIQTITTHSRQTITFERGSTLYLGGQGTDESKRFVVRICKKNLNKILLFFFRKIYIHIDLYIDYKEGTERILNCYTGT